MKSKEEWDEEGRNGGEEEEGRTWKKGEDEEEKKKTGNNGEAGRRREKVTLEDTQRGLKKSYWRIQIIEVHSVDYLCELCYVGSSWWDKGWPDHARRTEPRCHTPPAQRLSRTSECWLLFTCRNWLATARLGDGPSAPTSKGQPPLHRLHAYLRRKIWLPVSYSLLNRLVAIGLHFKRQVWCSS